MRSRQALGILTQLLGNHQKPITYHNLILDTVEKAYYLCLKAMEPHDSSWRTDVTIDWEHTTARQLISYETLILSSHYYSPQSQPEFCHSLDPTRRREPPDCLDSENFPIPHADLLTPIENPDLTLFADGKLKPEVIKQDMMSLI